MTYDKQTWSDGLAGGTPISGERLQHMEDGIDGAHTAIADLAAATHTHTSTEITDATATNAINTVVKRDGTGFIAVSGITGLSTATGTTQAVPKSQLDAAVAPLATSATVSLLDGRVTTAEADIVTLQGGATSLGGRVTTAEADIVALQGDVADLALADHTHDVTDVPATSTFTVHKSAGVWPARPTDRTDVTVFWIGADPSPPVVGSGTAGMYSNDVRLVEP